jgi:hypothetical protein
MKTLNPLIATVGLFTLLGASLASENAARLSLQETVRTVCAGCFTNYTPFSGDLSEDDTATVTFTVGSAREYTLVGACDEDCGDLNLELYAPGGKSVSKHRGLSKTPMVRAYLRPGVQYELDISLANCETEVCSYAVGIYRHR